MDDIREKPFISSMKEMLALVNVNVGVCVDAITQVDGRKMRKRNPKQ